MHRRNPIQTLHAILILIPLCSCMPKVPTIRPVPEEGSCRRILSEPGPEDMEILRSSGQDLIVYSSLNRRISEKTGGLYFIPLDPVSLESGNFTSYPLNVDLYPRQFRPHGISHSQFRGKNRLYAISHPGDRSDPSRKDLPMHTIEIFEESKPGFWKHLVSLKDPLLTSPNDLFALPEERLLISNDIGQDLNFRTLLDLIFQRSTSDIVYYAKGQFSPMNAKISFGNGIWYEGGKSPVTKGTLYRASHTKRSIFIYEVEWEKDELPPILKLKDTIPFPGGPDNLYSNAYGFYTTTHNSDLKFLRHSRSVENRSPSQVWEIQNRREARLIFSDPGEEISAASTAIRYQNWLFISQVFDNFILVCKIQ